MMTTANHINGIQIHTLKDQGNHKNTKQMRHVTVRMKGRLMEVVMQWGWGGWCFTIEFALCEHKHGRQMKAKHGRHYSTK